MDNWLKKAALEVQEYVRLVGQAFRGIIRPPYYRYDIVDQFDAIGVQSMTVSTGAMKMPASIRGTTSFLIGSVPSARNALI
jgi:hypothetical protein